MAWGLCWAAGAFAFMHLKGEKFLQNYWTKHQNEKGRVWGIKDDYCHDAISFKFTRKRHDGSMRVLPVIHASLVVAPVAVLPEP